jgi:hypothetical protein
MISNELNIKQTSTSNNYLYANLFNIIKNFTKEHHIIDKITNKLICDIDTIISQFDLHNQYDDEYNEELKAYKILVQHLTSIY